MREHPINPRRRGPHSEPTVGAAERRLARRRPGFEVEKLIILSSSKAPPGCGAFGLGNRVFQVGFPPGSGPTFFGPTLFGGFELLSRPVVEKGV
jgi:hypothetical protein